MGRVAATVPKILRKIKLSNYLIPWNRVLPEMLTSPQLVKKFPNFMESESSLAFTRARYLSRS
jgi:hypothetical protein